jgi:hypothetical protein
LLEIQISRPLPEIGIVAPGEAGEVPFSQHSRTFSGSFGSSELKMQPSHLLCSVEISQMPGRPLP